MRIAWIAHLACIAVIPAIPFAERPLASPAMAATAQTPAMSHSSGSTTEDLAHYTCNNGMTLDVAFFSVRGHDAVEVTLPTGRAEGATVRRLLPATQTGSGVRYASDITTFHMKGRDAMFETAASAQSEAIARTSCVLAAAPPAG